MGLDITDPTATPCIVAIPTIFPLSGGYRIPKGQPVDVFTIESICTLNGASDIQDLHMWYKGMRYGVAHLNDHSIHARDTLFVYEQIKKAQFTPDTNLVSPFTVNVTYLTPNDPLYNQVTDAVLATKGKAFVNFGSTLATTSHSKQAESHHYRITH